MAPIGSLLQTSTDNPFHTAVRARVVAHRLVFANPEPPRKVTWLDMLDIFGPSLVITSLGYRVLVVIGFAIWRRELALVVAGLLGATFVFRLFTIFRLAVPVRKILTWSVAADAIVVDAPRRGDVLVQVDGLTAPALEVSRNPNRPKIGQHVGVLMDRSRSQVLMFVG